MVGILSFFIGLLLVASALILMRREFLRASRDQRRSFNSLSDSNVDQVMQYLKKIEKELDDLNASYYDIVSDLEGKYSVHEKEIELIQEKLELLKHPVQTGLRSESSLKKTGSTAGSQVQHEPTDEQERICLEAVRLRQEGYTMGQIAKELNMGVGELQLILKTKR